METFKATFKEIDFAELSKNFLESSVGNKMDMLVKYCELEIALKDPNIIIEQLKLEWFARNLIDNLLKKSHRKQFENYDDDIHNDDDDAFLLYYLNEVNKDK